MSREFGGASFRIHAAHVNIIAQTSGGKGVVAAKSAGAPYKAPAMSPKQARGPVGTSGAGVEVWN